MSYYDEIAEGYSELHGEEQLKKARIVRDYINVNSFEKLLDVGCGDGAYFDIFKCEVIGVDPSKELVSRYKGRHKVVLGSAENLPFKDATFDVVISITAIQNFNDLEKGLSEIARVGKGRFALSFLKRSVKAKAIKSLINNKFNVIELVDEDKDLIFFCTKKH